MHPPGKPESFRSARTNPALETADLSRAAESQPIALDAVIDAPVTGLGAFVETTKPGITRLVVITSAVAFFVAWLSPGQTVTLAGVPWIALGACLFGTALSAAGANALNMHAERRWDAMMTRTAGRPLPSGRLEPRTVLLGGWALALGGPLVLLIGSGWVPAALSLATTLGYLYIYTPSKRTTPLSTIIGGVPGALPMFIGWTAGAAAIGRDPLASLTDAGGWALFLILFIWQIPHFLAIAWRYADDYARAGYKVLPSLDPTGRTTSMAMLAWTACLLPASLAPLVASPAVAGPIYAAVATLTGVLFLGAAGVLIREPSAERARAVFFASIIHLPLLMMALVAEGLLRQFLPPAIG